ncbi:hypothetical protein RCC89_16780 [Cytophagaceae bacterium ABcell3]|nr:hypothetical protein RCC89_16780 [Cytophagaceae bacterium ABcell3]
MKKLTLKAITLAAMTTFASFNVEAASTKDGTPATTEVVSKEDQLMERLQEIDEMDKSELNRKEKKELRKEVRGIKKELKAEQRGPGLYISGGALLLAIVLLLVLL